MERLLFLHAEFSKLRRKHLLCTNMTYDEATEKRKEYIGLVGTEYVYEDSIYIINRILVVPSGKRKTYLMTFNIRTEPEMALKRRSDLILVLECIRQGEETKFIDLQN